MYKQYIINTNKKICKNSQVRNYNYLNNISSSITKTLAEESNIIQNALQVAAIIKLYQPFYDGNHRTALIIFSDILTQKGYTFNIEQALIDMKNHKLNIPTIYTETDAISQIYIEKYNKYILDKPKSL